MKKTTIKTKDQSIIPGKEDGIINFIKSLSLTSKVFIGNEFKNEIILDISLDKSGRLIYEGIHGPFAVNNSDEIWYFED